MDNNITHFIAIVDMTYQAKNKLQKEVLEYFLEIDRTMVEAKDLDFMKQIIVMQIESINTKNSRCKPLKVHFESQKFWESTRSDDWVLRHVGVVAFSIRACIETKIKSIKFAT